MAAERIGAFDILQRRVGGFDAGFVAVGPLDLNAFLGEQALVIGDKLRQTLERRGGFEHELFHGLAPSSVCDRWGRRIPEF
jgi:hypothetical protein